jgi:hypothetical protein
MYISQTEWEGEEERMGLGRSREVEREGWRRERVMGKGEEGGMRLEGGTCNKIDIIYSFTIHVYPMNSTLRKMSTTMPHHRR